MDRHVGLDLVRITEAAALACSRWMGRGDKNGADITMALDALEMCFTHDHINAFVIVGGDSDFISLVEKLKQYGRTVIVFKQGKAVVQQAGAVPLAGLEAMLGKAET